MVVSIGNRLILLLVVAMSCTLAACGIRGGNPNNLPVEVVDAIHEARRNYVILCIEELRKTGAIVLSPGRIRDTETANATDNWDWCETKAKLAIR